MCASLSLYLFCLLSASLSYAASVDHCVGEFCLLDQEAEDLRSSLLQRPRTILAKLEADDVPDAKRSHPKNYVQVNLSQSNARTHVSLGGFNKGFLNTRYFADASRKINGYNTYSNGKYFLWWCDGSSAWYVTWEGNREKVASYPWHCRGWAYAPRDKDILDPSRIKGWHAWTGSAWALEPNAGVIGFSCGAYVSKDLCLMATGCLWDAKKPSSLACGNDWDIIRPGHEPKYSDISQGDLASCYFLAAIASIAHAQPNIISNMFVDRHLWEGDNPVYTTKWLLGGKPSTVVVDSTIPVDPVIVDPFFVTYNDGFDFWPLVLEKSWAKIFGSFKAIEYGFGAEVFKAITQAPVDFSSHRQHSKDDIWSMLQDATQNKFPVTSLTGSTTTNNLASRHVYAFLRSGVKADGTRYVNMYNPWSSERYRGDLYTTDSKNDGEFDMTIDEYFSAFYSTTVAHVYPGYVVSAISLPNERKAQLTFTMNSGKPFFVQLEWPGGRLVEKAGCGKPSVTAMLEVYHVNDKRNTLITASRTQRSPWTPLPVVRVRMPGRSGTYAVSIDARFANGYWMENYVLNTYAAETTEFELATPEEKNIDSVTLSGFQHEFLNTKFSSGDERINGEKVYWTSSKRYFLYFCSSNHEWMVAWQGNKAKIENGRCSGWASSSGVADIFDSLKKGWWEWMGSKWQFMSEAGVLDINSATSVTFGGFDHGFLNTRFHLGDERINGEKVYWTSSKSYFLYFCSKWSQWRIAWRGNRAKIENGGCYGWAHSNGNVDIFDPKNKGWGEWTGSSWKQKPNAGVIHVDASQDVALIGANITHSQGVERCRRLIARMDSLHDTEQILAGKGDMFFPADLSSIAAPGSSCGDSAQEISEACEKYNHWQTFEEIMAFQAR